MAAFVDHPDTEDDDRTIGSSSSSSFCPPFRTDEALDAYVAAFAPSRELVCPITQCLVRDPVVAEDGHTYERTALVTWFGMGRNRSPVTNAIVERTDAAGLVPNLAVAGLAAAHRERLGRELLALARGVREREGRVDAAGVGARLALLLDHGADPNGRGEGANTPLHLLIQSGNIQLVTHLLDHDVSVRLTNDAGQDGIAAAEHAFARHQQRTRRAPSGDATSNHAATVPEWHDFIRELKRRDAVEKERMEARDRARTQANDEHRERQRSLAAHARADAATGDPRGLGRSEEGVGYFPSLATLQFQGSIPGPSPSVAEYENQEKERLNSLLKVMGCIVVAYLLMN